jgi:hypothetical protein
MVAKVFISWIANNKVLRWTKLLIIVLVNRKQSHIVRDNLPSKEKGFGLGCLLTGLIPATKL